MVTSLSRPRASPLVKDSAAQVVASVSKKDGAHDSCAPSRLKTRPSVTWVDHLVLCCRWGSGCGCDCPLPPSYPSISSGTYPQEPPHYPGGNRMPSSSEALL